LADRIAPVVPVRYTENLVNGFLPSFKRCIQRNNATNDLQENIPMLAISSASSDEKNPIIRHSFAIN
jgi:hypothetical protein